MALSIFDDPSAPPAEAELRQTLGPALDNWERLRRGALESMPKSEEEVGYGGKKFGWSWRTKCAGKLMLALSPGNCKFVASFAIGEKAFTRAKANGLDEWLVAVVESSPRYAEGRGVRIEVRPDTAIEPILGLLAFKAGIA